MQSKVFCKKTVNPPNYLNLANGMDLHIYNGNDDNHTATRTHPMSAASILIVTDWSPQMIIYLYECPLLACRRSPVPNLSQWSRDRLIKTICRPLCGAKWPDGMLLDPSHASPNTSIIQPGRGDRWTTGTGPGGTWIFSFSFSRCCFDSPHT